MVVATDPSKGIDFSDSNSYTTTDEGKALFEAYIESKGSVRLTDLMESANASSDLMMAQGFDFSHLEPEEAKKMSRRLTLAMGKMKLPTDADEAAAAKIPYGRGTGARTSDQNMINYVLEFNIPGITYYSLDGSKLPQDQIDLHKGSNDQKASATPIGYIQFNKRTIATPAG